MEAANDLMTKEMLQGDTDNGQEQKQKQKRLQVEGVENQEHPETRVVGADGTLFEKQTSHVQEAYEM